MSDYQYITKHNSTNYTPAAKVRAVFGRPRTITGITIHHWGRRGQKFANVVSFLDGSTGNTATSAHEVIEAGRVAVLVNHKDVAWHAGNNIGNTTTLGLELRPEATKKDYATAAQRIADLRKFYGPLPLIPHKHWKNTACPGAWNLAKLDQMANDLAAGKPATPSTPSTPAGKTYKIKAGDTLSGIAVKHKTTVGRLQSLNGITNPNKINAGATIKVR